ncbi:hypothetical protein GQ600_6478 [Phytophthora cactorum]|nr:hypothetical protein GQ600_6478 [Phytophthora cactorum]
MLYLGKIDLGKASHRAFITLSNLKWFGVCREASGEGASV